MKPDLKPCPFPYKGITYIEHDHWPSLWVLDAPGYHVQCTCGCRGPSHPTPADAIAAWNTRAEPNEADMELLDWMDAPPVLSRKPKEFPDAD